LKNKGLNSAEVLEKRELTPKLTPKNPNEYNGEVIDNQSFTSKNTDTKKLSIILISIREGLMTPPPSFTN